jgi:hypothetical protein
LLFDPKDGGDTFFREVNLYQLHGVNCAEDVPNNILCFYSDVVSVGITAMGGALTYFWEGEDPKLDIPDPRTGLTPRERQAVVDTWAILKPHAKQTGVELFMRSVPCYIYRLLYYIM